MASMASTLALLRRHVWISSEALLTFPNRRLHTKWLTFTIENILLLDVETKGESQLSSSSRRR